MSLEAEYHQLKAKLQEFVQEAARNEDILRRLHGFELRLLACRGFAELLDVLLADSLNELRLDAVSLWLYDPEGVLRDLLTTQPDSEGERSPNLRFLDELSALRQIYGRSTRPRAGTIDLAGERLFVESGLESVALLPLMRHKLLIGSVHIGSRNPTRFTADMATDYVERLAAIIALCLDNACQQEQLRKLSLIDVLTKANNRRSFDQELERELNRACRTRSQLTCLLLDIDHFKRINDEFGHQTGDRALKLLAHAVRQELRRTDLLARYGGEEFAILLPDTDCVAAFHIAERIRKRAATTPIFHERGHVRLTVSVGLTTWQPDEITAILPPQTPALLVASTDKALYQAKALGRNRVCSQPFGENVLLANPVD